MTIEDKTPISLDEGAIAEAEAITAEGGHEPIIVRTAHFLKDVGKVAVSGQATAALAEAFRAARF
jgi:hypothetical protein